MRKKAIKEIILELHAGKTVEEVKRKFEETVKDVSAEEIAAIEQEIINEGVPIEDVKRLCDVHLSIFKSALDKTPDPETSPGHPIYTFKAENRAIEILVLEIEKILSEVKSAGQNQEKDLLLKMKGKLNLLWDVEKHYSRKENLLFPFLEKYDITGPSKIMWSHDDEIRAGLKEAKSLIITDKSNIKEQFITKTEETLQKIKDMIMKEEKVLFNTALKVLNEGEWYHISQDSADIGYCLIEPEKGWKPSVNTEEVTQKTQIAEKSGSLKFNTGVLTPKEISLIFNHLPVDITYVNKEGIVKYFSDNKERIFVRASTIIGRKVENCHPPASVEIVEKLVADLASGKKDSEDFWLHLGDKYVLIRYFAVRDEAGEFMGVMEVSQDIKPIQMIKGQKRIMD